MSKTSRALAALTVVLTALTACSPGSGEYSNFANLPEGGWAFDAPLSFVTDTVDSVSTGRIIVALRHNNSYDYSNLWLKICYNNNRRRVVDTVNITLADLYGRWEGKGFGASYQKAVTVARGVRMMRGDTITVSHIMRVDTLRGVEQLGVEFEKTDN